ncbi:hypothetical protein BN7874_179 [Phage NCTB]|nr:hypothetical protein BN7874_179 [Phage NCTB]
MKNLLLLTLLPQLSFAGQVVDNLTVSGYGSVRVGTLHSEKANPQLLGLYSESDEISFDESFFGVQANLALTDDLTAIVQVTADAKQDFELKTEWAYLNYDINQNFSVSAGRLAMPIFYYSRYEHVGYAHNFARLPISVYIGHEFDVIEGIDFSTKHFITDGLFLRTDWIYGSWKGDLYESINNTYVESELSNIKSFSFELECTDCGFTLFGGYWESDADVGELNNTLAGLIKPQVDLVGAQPDQVSALYDALSIDDKAQYWYTGFRYEINQDLTLASEYASYGLTDSIDSFNKTWYVAASYRLYESHTVTIHAERYFQDFNNFKQLADVDDSNLLAIGEYAITLFGQRQFDFKGITWRYDFAPRVDFKADFVWGEDKRSHIGDIKIISLGVDFIF